MNGIPSWLRPVSYTQLDVYKRQTLTNMKERDIERIIRMQLAPINISIQTTNPELRCKMLHNRFAGETLKYMQMLYDGHVEMNGQVVCCKGVNDGEELCLLYTSRCV